MSAGLPQESLEADDLRRLMNVVRHRMSHEAAGVADGARQLTDWRFYVQNFTGPILATCAFLGYLAVPRKEKPYQPDEKLLSALAGKERVVVETRPAAAQKPGLVDSMLTMSGNLLLRSALAYAGQQIGKVYGEQAAQSAPQE